MACSAATTSLASSHLSTPKCLLGVCGLDCLDLRPQLLSIFPLQDPRNPKGHQVTEARAGPGVSRWATSHPGARAATGRSPEGSRRGARQTPQWLGRRRRPEQGAGWWTPGELRPEAPRSRRRTAHPQPSRFARPVAAVRAPPAGPSRFRGRTPRARRCASTGVGPKKKSILVKGRGTRDSGNRGPGFVL